MGRLPKRRWIAGVAVLLVALMAWMVIVSSGPSLPQAQKLQATLTPLPGSQIMAVAWNATGDLLAVGDSSGVVTIVRFSLDKSRPLSSSFAPLASLKADAKVYALTWSPSDDLAIGCDNGDVKTFDLQHKQVKHQLKTRPGFITSLLWSADGEQLVVSSDNETTVWHLPTERLLISAPVRFAQAHWGKSRSVLAGIDSDGNTEIWNVDRSQLETTLDNRGWWSELSPDGRHVAAAMGNEVEVWEIGAGTAAHGFQGDAHAAGLTGLSWSTDSTRIASRSGILGEDYTVKIWRLSDYSLECTLKGHTNDPTYLEWFAGDTRLVSVGADQTVRIWDAKTCEMVEGFYVPDFNVVTGTLNLSMNVIAVTNKAETLEFWYLGSALQNT